MDLRALRSFVVVADYAGFSRAAEHLGISQPALSRQISALESELDVRLFDRIGRQTVLTPAGQDLLGGGTRQQPDHDWRLERVHVKQTRSVVSSGSVILARLQRREKLFTNRGFERSGRQRHGGFDLEQGARYRQRRHADRGAGRRRRHIEIAIPQFAKRSDILANIDDVTVDLNNVLR